MFAADARPMYEATRASHFPRIPMSPTCSPRFRVALALLAAVVLQACGAPLRAAPLPAPAVDTPKATTPGVQTAVFAGGCFWGVEAVFRHVEGVKRAVSGYAGGNKQTAQYEIVSTGMTGHAESVQVTYDPSRITYGELLRIFFSVAHDPTQLNRQGPDHGTQYRSAIFVENADQKRIADAYIAQLTAAKALPAPIVTQVVQLPAFYPAEDYHQNYLANHPDQPYIVYNDLPKLAALKEQFPARYVGK
jgi:peptide-methionine (S)-S-oxide reductase